MKDFNRASITWTVKEMVRLANAGKIKFDNAVQRGLVWDDGKKSLLIDSILHGYEIPPMYANKGEGGISDAEVQEIFYRLNNGKPLSTYEQTRVKAKSLNEVQALSQMSLFDSDKTGRKYPGYKKEELIFRLMMTLTEENPDLERKSLTEYIRTHTITEEEQERAFDAFKLYASITDAVLSTATPEEKK